jgi:hypothetical protein
MKKILSVISLILLTGFVSAQFYGGGLSFGNFLYSIDSSTAFLGVVFVVAFALLQLSLTRVFKDNKPIASTIALAISFFIVWWLNQSGTVYNLFYYNIFYFFNLPPGFFETLWPIAALLILIGMMVWKGPAGGFGFTLMLYGAVLFLLGVVNYEGEAGLWILGIIFIVIGFFIWMKWGKKEDKNTINVKMTNQ